MKLAAVVVDDNSWWYLETSEENNIISNGRFGDSCDHITSNPQQTPWGQ